MKQLDLQILLEPLDKAADQRLANRQGCGRAREAANACHLHEVVQRPQVEACSLELRFDHGPPIADRPHVSRELKGSTMTLPSFVVAPSPDERLRRPSTQSAVG